MIRQHIAGEIERFVRTQFQVAATDTRFSRSAPLFEAGYVDSVGFVELIAFLAERFDVEVPDDVLLSDAFTTIDSIAGVVTGLRNGGRNGWDARES